MRAASVNSGDANTAATAAPGDPKNPVQDYNTGTAAYRAGRFPQATQAFQQSITHAPSSNLKRLADQQDAYYDLGNTLYRAGQTTEKSAPQETLQKWTDAVKAYETALQLRADDADSKFNRDFVQRKIDALKQQQNPDQQNKGGGLGQGQPPNTPQNTKNNDPQQGQPPSQPPSQPQATGSKEGQSPPGAARSPSAARDGEPQPGDEAGGGAEDQRAVGNGLVARRPQPAPDRAVSARRERPRAFSMGGFHGRGHVELRFQSRLGLPGRLRSGS